MEILTLHSILKDIQIVLIQQIQLHIFLYMREMQYRQVHNGHSNLDMMDIWWQKTMLHEPQEHYQIRIIKNIQLNVLGLR